MFYSNEKLNETIMQIDTDSKRFSSISLSASHEPLIEAAGGNTLDTFLDPRPNENGLIKVESYLINYDNPSKPVIQGINFAKNGEFCCSYVGNDYQNIKEYHKLNCEQKHEKEAFAKQLDQPSFSDGSKKEFENQMNGEVEKDSDVVSTNNENKNGY